RMRAGWRTCFGRAGPARCPRCRCAWACTALLRAGGTTCSGTSPWTGADLTGRLRPTMSLAGNLRTMELPDVLQWVSSGRKTGTLYLERHSIQKRIYFQDGGIYTSSSNDPRESMGQLLIRERLVSEEQLYKALL